MITDNMPRKENLTLDELVHVLQSTWISRVRDGQLYALQAGSHVLTWAREHADDFVVYCKRNGIVGATHETRVVELMLAADPDGVESGGQPRISRERRAEYAAGIGWFADCELCPETDEDKAVALARQKGRMTGIAQEYRQKKDADNPKAQAAKKKGQATKARRADKAAPTRDTGAKEQGSTPARSTGLAETIFDDKPNPSDDGGERPVFLQRRNEDGEPSEPDHELAEEIIAAGRPVELPSEFDQLPGVALWLTVRKGTEVYAFGPIYDDRLVRAASIRLPMQSAA
jgi:hypothetical protein